MIRSLSRDRPIARIRLWMAGASPDGPPLPLASTVAEWAGRTGHPTSYGLLGVAPASCSGVRFLLPEGRVFVGALAGRNDEVIFGLPEPYRKEVESVLLGDPTRGWDVVVAAHGRVGSSQMAFRRLATFVLNLHELDFSNASDEDLWAAWDTAGAIWRDP